MAILIDYLPKTAEYDFKDISKAQNISPTLGSGPESVLQRPGDKSGMEIMIPALSTKKCGPALVVDLLEGKYQGVVIPIPEPKMPVLDYGAPLVEGSGQGGKTLNIKNGEPGVEIRKGKWLSVIILGQRFAYQTRAVVTFDENGKASLPIRPMIRVSPPNDSVVELAKPMMEGLVKSNIDRLVRNIGDMAVARFLVVEKR